MGFATRPYEGASRVGHLAGTLEGADVFLSLHLGYASDGWKSDFQRRPVAWVSLRRAKTAHGAGVYRCRRYSGRSLRKALADWTKIASEVRPLMASTTHDEIPSTGVFAGFVASDERAAS